MFDAIGFFRVTSMKPAKRQGNLHYLKIQVSYNSRRGRTTIHFHDCSRQCRPTPETLCFRVAGPEPCFPSGLGLPVLVLPHSLAAQSHQEFFHKEPRPASLQEFFSLRLVVLLPLPANQPETVFLRQAEEPRLENERQNLSPQQYNCMADLFPAVFSFSRVIYWFY